MPRNGIGSEPAERLGRATGVAASTSRSRRDRGYSFTASDANHGELATLAKDENANQKIRGLFLRLGIFIGLDFAEGRWGKWPVRRLRRGVIAFGEDNLPVPIHGRSRADDLARDPASTGGRNHTHSAPACCRAQSADSGSSAGEGAGNNRTEESNSGLEQTHQGTTSRGDRT